MTAFNPFLVAIHCTTEVLNTQLIASTLGNEKSRPKRWVGELEKKQAFGLASFLASSLAAWSISSFLLLSIPALVSSSKFHLSPTDLACPCLTHLLQGHPVLGDWHFSSSQVTLSSQAVGIYSLLLLPTLLAPCAFL